MLYKSSSRLSRQTDSCIYDLRNRRISVVQALNIKGGINFSQGGRVNERDYRVIGKHALLIKTKPTGLLEVYWTLTGSGP